MYINIYMYIRMDLAGQLHVPLRREVEAAALRHR